jgi:arylsulfatase A-like enzyme
MSSLTRRDLARLTAASAAAPLSGAAGPRPNVIIVLTDDQGYGDMACHGHKELKTPVLDRLHSQSVRFTDFHSSPMCTPTRAQLMTGRDSLATRAMNVSSGRTLLRGDIPTMPEVFAANGYRTGIFGKWHLGDNYPYRPEDRGFQEAVWYPSSHIGSVPDAWNNDYFNDRYRHNGRLEQYQGYSGDVFVDQAMRWIRSGQASQPFFAYIPLNVAHGPLFVPPRFREPYKHLPERFARYYGMVANIDYNVGRIEKMLEETGLRDNTILVFLTDNGNTKATSANPLGMRGNKTELYEGGHRVPCFLRWPKGGVGGGRDSAELAQMQDMLPTLIDLCRLERPRGAAFDGTSLAALAQGKTKSLPDRTLVVQFSRMDRQRPQKDDAAVMWKRWRLVHGKELYDLAADPSQQTNLFDKQPAIVKRLQQHYDRWWAKVEPALDSFLPLHVGSDKENPTLLSACEWADVFLDQGAQVRRGERKIAKWSLQVERDGWYEVALRRWPRDCDAGLAEAVPEHVGEDGKYLAGVALPIAKARIRTGAFDRTIEVQPSDREARFRVQWKQGPSVLETWFLDAQGAPITSAYYAYVERKEASGAARVIFDTDIMGDVDDVGAVAALHALASRGEAEILGMCVSSKHAWSPLCLDAFNLYFGRPGIEIGVNKGPGFLRDSKYAEAIARNWTRRYASAEAMPDAVALYRRLLAREEDGAVVLISVGQLTNMANLLASGPDASSPLSGKELVRRKIRRWVCMGARFPSGREANVYHDPGPAARAVAEWPGEIVFSGWEIGQDVLTGGALATLPASSPVRRAYELYNGARPHKSWDQTAVWFGVRGAGEFWTLSAPGVCEIDASGANTWLADPHGRHRYLVARAPVEEVGRAIEKLMLQPPSM